MTLFLSVLTIISGLLLAGSVTFITAPKNTNLPAITPTPTLEQIQVLGASTQATPLVSPTPTPKIISTKPTLSPTPILIPTSAPSITTTIVIILTPIPQPSITPTPTSIPTPTPVLSIIKMEIREPNKGFSFNLHIQDGINACQALEKAKDQDKITSLTLDDKYLTTFNTLLVKEIDGFLDNWVFTVNGDSPMGCSLVILKNQDSVVWTYLTN